MTATSDIRSGPTNGLLAALRRSMPRDEFFAGLYILGCANGIGGVVIIALHNNDDWLSTVLSISAVVVFACFAGISLLLRDKTDEIRVPDLAVGAVFLIVVTVSIGYLNWARGIRTQPLPAPLHQRLIRRQARRDDYAGRYCANALEQGAFCIFRKIFLGLRLDVGGDDVGYAARRKYGAVR